MSKFKVGDKVVRLAEHRNEPWQMSCARHNVTYDLIGTVDGVLVAEGSRRVKLKEFSSDREHCAWWDAAYFTYAPAPAASVDALASEVARCCGTVADKPNMEKVVKQLSDEVTELKHTINVQNQDLAEAQSRLTSIKEYASIADQQRNEAEDQRDAAVLAAKTLGDEVQELRRERREYRVGVAGAKGHISTLMAGIDDIDLSSLSSQLDQIGRMADEQGNGADAKMCFDASQVLDMVERFLSSYDAE